MRLREGEGGGKGGKERTNTGKREGAEGKKGGDKRTGKK